MTMVDYGQKFLDNLKKARTVALDTETISLIDRTMVGFSIAYGKNYDYIAVKDKFLENMPEAKAKKLLQFILENCHVVCHNSSFDLPVIADFGVKIPDKLQLDDTVVMANLINENKRHGLKPMVKQYFNYRMRELKEIIGAGKNQKSFDEVSDCFAKVDYACDDAIWTLKLYHALQEQLDNDKVSAQVYEKIEKPLLLVVAKMHINGIRINVDKVIKISDKCKTAMEYAEDKLKILMGNDVNFNSTKQLREFFIDKERMPILKQTPAGKPSVDKEVLEIYAETNGTAKLLLEYRKYAKIFTTFIPALTPTNWDPQTMTGRIYTSFNQAGTTSGRFSSSRPNMQNIPADEEFKEIRGTIIPEEGHIFIGADYSQIELRVLAHFSQDVNLLRAYNEHKDIHQQTADALGIDRSKAKTINFGLVYGMGIKTLSKRVKASYDEAEMYINKFFETYSAIKPFWKEAEEKFKNFGFVQTYSGRKKRRTQQFFIKDEYEQSGEIRSATNAVIQGTAADLMKIAMVKMWPELDKLGAKMVLTVHDEVLVSCPVKNAKRAYGIIHRAMVTAGDGLSVLIEVNVKFGRTWEEAHGDGIKFEYGDDDA